MTQLETFFEAAIHTDESALHTLNDHTVDEMIVKMCAMNAPCEFRLNKRTLQPEINTPLGVYTLILNDTGERLVIDQVI